MTSTLPAIVPANIKDDVRSEHVEKLTTTEVPGIDDCELAERERICVRKLDFVIAPLLGAFNFIVR